jgi:2-polyprenyl-3-methyl-5-hydroxy-6-metoxy-1,4-benzoquinol methylase
MQAEIENTFYELAIDQGMYSTKPKLKFRLNYFFNQVSLSNKKVLDVGGGAGLLTFYAAVKGAKKVVCLEPECDGSHNGMIDKFNKFKSALQFPLPVEHLPLTLQDYLKQVRDEEFDIIALHNSINHLDEEACIHLRKRRSSYEIYKNIFTDVYNKMKPGGKLMVADCSCKNFLNTIGLKSYFYPTIEWHKHQTPETWIALLKEVGFRNPKVAWTTPNRLGKPGRVLMGNSLASYFIGTGFKFTMDK